MRSALPDTEPLSPGEQSTYEVLVTDDGSCSTARAMIAEHYPWARWLAGPGRGPAANRNNGANHASGEWLAFVDDDCLPDAGWLEALRDTVSTEPLDVVEGKIVCLGKRDSPFEEHVENLDGGNYWSANLAVLRTVFQRMTGFHEGFLEAGGEDMEFAWRIARDKLRVRFVPAFLVIHPPRKMTWRKLWHRIFMIRWTRLYLLATEQALPMDANPLSIAWNLVFGSAVDLLRSTSHLATRFDRAKWRRQLFSQALQWIAFPLVVPYLLVWEFRFRKQLGNLGNR